MSEAGPHWLEPDWPAPARIRAVSTLRGGGVSTGPYASLNLGSRSGDDPSAVATNRRRLLAAARVPGEPSWLAQVHGAGVIDLDAAAPGDAPPAADASVARRAGVVCAILTADCMPILLTSESGDVVAAAHAGWRGLAGGVIEATVAAMAAPATLMAWLGPAIGPSHFEVGPEVLEAMLRSDAGAAVGFTPNARGRYLADLELLARRRLEALGVRRIHGGGRCTFSDAQCYFSHRRDQGKTGRHATLIWREAAPGPDRG
ncbi:MAG TPA: peptidoglycan editing factor PgeF [Steroidobacteraceae bacterium]|jgi:hypothetical protein|nr:peptidoglycan editing factor PgeF [Steroidobacteraceae bacterium]